MPDKFHFTLNQDSVAGEISTKFFRASDQLVAPTNPKTKSTVDVFTPDRLDRSIGKLVHWQEPQFTLGSLIEPS